MKVRKISRCLVAAVLTASTVLAVTPTSALEYSLPQIAVDSQQLVSASAVSIQEFAGYENAAYVKWSPVTNATGYNVYCDGTQIDAMLIRQYSSYFRADAVGLKEGNHTLKVVPVIDGKEDTSNETEVNVTSTKYDRTGFAFSGTDGSCGAYNADGTLKTNAVVLYITEDTKDTVTLDVATGKETTTKTTGLQNIINAYKKGYDSRPLAIRVVGTVTDPSVTEGGDFVISGSGDTKRLSCGITIEGIGEDALFHGFGIRAKNISGLEIRNMGVMLVDSSERDNYSLQQSCDHVWVHNCDSFYGTPGSDDDQIKGDGALDCKKSTYITFSYNHFWDNGKCNLLGLSENTTEDLYITYHHNWYDHSDSRHPRVRFYSAHVYNNYYDGNAKYGIGSTRGSSVFAENNYFRNCKYPMLTSMQGSDIAGSATGTFGGEDGGTIKSYGNYMEGQKAFVPYSRNNTEFDAYDASSKTEKVPATVISKIADSSNKISKGSGGNTYNNFDTDSSVMYSYTADAAADVPSIVMAKAGRLNGGDFQWEFDDSVDDTSYDVNADLKAALEAYKPSVIAIGSGFKSDVDVSVTTTTVTPVTTSLGQETTTTAKTTAVPMITTPITPVSDALYCAPGAGGSGTLEDPMDVLVAIEQVKAGQTIYLLEGDYAFDSTILIDQNNCGAPGSFKTLSAYPGADVTFDFSSEPYDTVTENGKVEPAPTNQRGIQLDGSYWHFYNFEVYGAADNGVYVTGNNNTIEMCVFDANRDTGLQISRRNSSLSDMKDWPANNLILNCTARNNCDDATMENADGFAAKLTCGEGNVFDGCMSYNNSDDGWDLYAKSATGPIGIVTIKNCVAFRNGFTEDGKGYGDCDGNGFKLGGGGVGTAHVIENCLAFENLNCGFTDNNNPELGSLTNCTAYNNSVGGNGKANYMVYRCKSGCDVSKIVSYFNTEKVSNTGAAGVKLANDKFYGTVSEAIYYNSKYYYTEDAINTTGSSVKLGDVITPTESDFISLSVPAMGTDFHIVWRNSDGSINTGGFAETTGTYQKLGYHFTNSNPVVTTTATATKDGKTTTTTTTTTTTAVPVTTDQISVDALYGDVNLDNDVSLSDLVTFQKYLRQAITFNDQQKANANVDLTNAEINDQDATALMRFLIKLTDTIPIQ